MAVEGVVGPVGSFQDVAVRRENRRVGHVRGAMVVGTVYLLTGFDDVNVGPGPMSVECTLLRRPEQIPDDRADLLTFVQGGGR